MNRLIPFLTGVFSLASCSLAATPPVEQLLPADTIGLLTVPDWDKAVAYFDQSAPGQLWQDPVLKPFKDRIVKSFNEGFVASLEKELGIKLADYSGLVHGQITFAVIQNGWDGRSEKEPAVFLFVEVKDRADQLKNQLSELRKKWVDSGRQLKSEKIRDVEFTTLLVKTDELNRTLQKVFPASPEPGDARPDKPDAEGGSERFEVSFGQSDSLLIVGNTLQNVEKILIRQSGGLVPMLVEQAGYEAIHAAMFRDAIAFGWLNLKPILANFARQGADAAAAQPFNPLAPPPGKILEVTGLGAVQSIAIKASGSAEGSFLELFCSLPESERVGILNVLLADSREAAPPRFVPADAVKFSRWRLDGPKAWAAIEATLKAVSPEMAGGLQLILETVGKDKDPNFDLKKSLLGNLGDDFLSYEKNARADSLAALSAPPTLYLVGSPNPEGMVNALKSGVSLLPAGSADDSLKEREFLGRKIYSIPLPSMPGTDDSKGVKRSFNFSASAGYVAFSTDVALLEEFLRSSESTGPTLREAAGLNEAAQKVGGMNTGFFAYENLSDGFRTALEAWKNNAARLNRVLSSTSIGEKLNAQGGALNKDDWLDFSLLPPFDQIAKYFHFIVYSASATPDGFHWKLFAPTPPKLRK